MPSCTASLHIAAPRDAVWQALSGVDAWADWLPTISSVQPLDGRALNVGARFLVHQPKLRPATWTVTLVEPPRRFTWEARSPGLRMVADHLVDETPGGTRVTLRYDISGWLGVPAGWVYRGITERYLAQELASLQQKVERPR